MTSNTDTTNTLQWLAFRYVAGEMQTDEAAQFEQRMLSDLDACEAVIRSMQLSETVVAAFEQPAAAVAPAKLSRTTEPQPISRRLSLAASASALAGAFALALFATQSRDIAPSLESTQTSELVRLWTTSKDSTAIVVDDVEANATEASQPADLQVPDWLIAALEAKQRDADEDDILEN